MLPVNIKTTTKVQRGLTKYNIDLILEQEIIS